MWDDLWDWCRDEETDSDPAGYTRTPECIFSIIIQFHKVTAYTDFAFFGLLCLYMMLVSPVCVCQSALGECSAAEAEPVVSAE